LREQLELLVVKECKAIPGQLARPVIKVLRELLELLELLVARVCKEIPAQLARPVIKVLRELLVQLDRPA
jgi:hypothetical protein